MMNQKNYALNLFITFNKLINEYYLFNIQILYYAQKKIININFTKI